MDDEQRRVDVLGEANGAVRRLALRHRRPRHRMEVRRVELAPQFYVEQLGRDPCHELVRLGVHHNHRAVLAAEQQHVEHLRVAQLERVVRHVHLDGRDAVDEALGQ
eukprot:1999136-Pleurochrysis_carterae.AAC.1